VVGTTVKACMRTVSGGRVKYDFLLDTASAYTDDRGMFRHTNLLPGDYIVAVASGVSTIPVSFRDTYGQRLREGTAGDLDKEIDASSAVVPTNSGLRMGDFILDAGRRQVGFDGGIVRPGPGLIPAGADGKLLMYRTTYFPGAPSPGGAAIVTLRSGEDRAGVDVQLPAVPAIRVSGTVIGPNGPQPYLGLRLSPTADEELGVEGSLLNVTTTTDARGAFTFLGVTPGPYRLKAVRRPPTAPVEPGAPFQPPSIPTGPTLWARMDVSAGDRDLDGLVVTLNTGARISGRLEFDGVADKLGPDRLPMIAVDLDPARGSGSGPSSVLGANTPILGRVDRTGHITSYGLPAGKYVIAVFGPLQGWTLKSAMYEGRDVSTVPFEISDRDLDGLVVTLTDHPVTVSGAVRTAEGRPDATASVVMFPVERTQWLDGGSNPRRIQVTRASRNGLYSFGSVPPGEYYMAALADDSLGSWPDPAFLSRIVPSATRVRVNDTGSASQDLQTRGVK
jgi:hypothetical protein